MVAVVVAEDDVAHPREIDLQLLRVLQDRVGPGPGVEEDAVPVGLHDRREAPFADAGGSQHGREDRDLERAHASVGRRARLCRGRGRHGGRHENGESESGQAAEAWHPQILRRVVPARNRV
jgi:hypothetical protein